MRTRFERQRALGEAIGTVAETLRLEEVGDQPLAWLARAMDASGILLYRYDELGRVAGHGGTIVAALPAYCAELFEEDPVQRALYTLERTPPVVVATRLAGFDERRYRRSAAYNEFYARHDMEHLIGAGITPMRYGAPGMTGILFSRSRHEQPFDDVDAAVLRDVLPAFQAAVRRSDRLSRETHGHGASAPPHPAPSRDAIVAALAARHGLTTAEAEVLSLIAEGLSNREIAARRFVSFETVRTHVQRVLGKLGVASRTQAAVLVQGACR
jgi:DNA-binding CsgD family transcriptional regulator